MSLHVSVTITTGSTLNGQKKISHRKNFTVDTASMVITPCPTSKILNTSLGYLENLQYPENLEYLT